MLNIIKKHLKSDFALHTSGYQLLETRKRRGGHDREAQPCSCLSLFTNYNSRVAQLLAIEVDVSGLYGLKEELELFLVMSYVYHFTPITSFSQERRERLFSNLPADNSSLFLYTRQNTTLEEAENLYYTNLIICFIYF